MNSKHEVINRIRENFPQELRDLDQWVVWRIEARDGKPTKVPYSIAGYRAASDKPKTWSSFADATNTYANDNYNGVGFMFSESDPYAGIDFDKCIEGNYIDPEKLKHIDRLDSYSEISQSKTGAHVIVRANLPPGGRKSNKHGIEMYDRLRFFVVTGDRMTDTPFSINDRQSIVNQFHAEIFPQKNETVAEHRPSEPVSIDDTTLLQKMFASRNGADIESLWRGNLTDYSGDHSAADLSLCNHLAFWTGNDPSRIDSLFRQSGLYRAEKWGRAARTGETYGAGTISRAINTTRTVYSPTIYKNGNGNGSHNHNDDEKEAPKAGIVEESPQAVNIDALLLRENTDDEGHAQCVHALYGGKFIHSPAIGWLHYVGTHWSAEGSDAAVERAITATLTRRAHLALSNDPVRYADLLKKCVRSHGRVGGIKGQLQSLEYVSTASFDSNPDLLNCKNGVVNLRTGEITPHLPSQHFLSCSPIEYKPDADSTHWCKWLADATSPDYANYLQMAVGYTLTGHTNEEVLFYMYGKPRSGKGTFTDAVLGIMGEEMGQSVSFSLFTAKNDVDSQNFAFAPLQKARFISASESNKSERFNEGKVKMVTGGDRIYCCYKGHDQFNYKPKFKIWLSSNWPVNADPDDEAVWGTRPADYIPKLTPGQ